MKRLMIFLLVGVLVISFSGGVLGVPLISNVPLTISNGQSAVISGSGFGTKSSVAPLIWDNLEDGSADTITSSLDRSDWDLSKNLVSNNLIRHAGQYSAQGTFNWLDEGHNFRITDSSLSDGDKIYVSFWRRYDGLMNHSTLNLKSFRIWAENAGSGSLPDVVTSWHGTALSGGLGPALIWTIEGCGSSGEGYYARNNLPNLTKWYLEEYIIQFSSDINQGDGVFKFIRDGTNFINRTDVVYRCTDYNRNMVRIVIDGYSNKEYSGDVFLDDIYIDTTWARVILCDSSTWPTRTHCEIQIPTLWADGSITVDINQGSFTDGETAYLFVVDENGDVSNGYGPIKLGTGASICNSGADSNPPDNIVSITELINYISQWKAGDVLIGDLITGIGEWKNGC